MAGLIFQPFLFIHTEFFQFIICLFNILICLRHIFELLSVLPAEKAHPADDSLFILIPGRQLFQFKDMQLHQIRILFSGFHITESNLPVTLFILRKMDEIQDAYMNAFLKYIIVFTLFDLPAVRFAYIKQYPAGPVAKISDLHLHIDF